MYRLPLLWGLVCGIAIANEPTENFAKKLRTWESEQTKVLVETYKTSERTAGSLAAIAEYEAQVDDWLAAELGYLDEAVEVPVSVNAARAYLYAEARKRKEILPQLGALLNDAFNRYYAKVLSTRAEKLEAVNRELKARLKDRRRYGTSALPPLALPAPLNFERETGHGGYASRLEALLENEKRRHARDYESLAVLTRDAAPVAVVLGPVPKEKKPEPPPAPEAPEAPKAAEPEGTMAPAATQTVAGQDPPPERSKQAEEEAETEPEIKQEDKPFEWSEHRGKKVYVDIKWNGRGFAPGKRFDTVYGALIKVLQGQDDPLFRYSRSGEIHYDGGVLNLDFFTQEVEKKTERVVDRDAPLIQVRPGVHQYQYKQVVVEKKVSQPLDDFGQELYAYKLKERVTQLWYAREVAAHRRRIEALAGRLKPFKDAKRIPPAIREEKHEAVVPEETSPVPFVLMDWHGRDLLKNGLALVDWEGHIANPAFKIFIRPRQGVSLPMEVTIHSDVTRLYFSNPSSAGKSGPRKIITLNNAEEWDHFYVSIWPDRDGKNEEHELKIDYRYGEDKVETVKLVVIDQDAGVEWQTSPVISPVRNPAFFDQPDERPFLQRGFPFIEEPFEVKDPWPFTITLDYMHDKSGYFRDEHKVNESVDQVVQLAVNDWAYFIDEMPYRDLRPGEETTEIQKHASNKDAKFRHQNRYTVKDFVLYFVGADTLTKPHAQAGARGETLEAVGSGADKMLRTGQVLLEGIHAAPGISLNVDSDDWWRFTHSDTEPGELYSYLIHEVGHPLFAYPTYPNWALWSPIGGLEREKLLDLRVTDYAGEILEVDSGDHLPEAVDRASRKQAFGAVEGRSPKEGLMPQRRWIVTKLDLLLMQEVGYKLKQTSPFVPLKMETKELSEGKLGERYRDGMKASGGIPYYYWEVAAGELPPGLRLDSYTGVVHGTPTAAGHFNFVLRLYDYDNGDGVGLAHATQIHIR